MLRDGNNSVIQQYKKVWSIFVLLLGNVIPQETVATCTSPHQIT